MKTRFNTLQDWLSWQEQLHPQSIDLGLERVYRVALELDLLQPPTDISHGYSGGLSHGATVITVAGTNGKGSCIKTLEHCLLDGGLVDGGLLDDGLLDKSPAGQAPRVGSYTSPHLHHYCERIRIDGEPVAESLVCEAFAAIDKARGATSLTYFEFGTLAALWIFARQQLPYVLLEVGLGGRLDAVNIVDADVAVITSIDIDHQAWLGDNREVISREKLGIARPTQPLIIAEQALTPSLSAAALAYPSQVLNTDFSILDLDQHLWSLSYRGDQALDGETDAGADIEWVLPKPPLPLSSVAAALMALRAIDHFPAVATLRQRLATLQLPGRFEQTQIEQVTLIYDVAHNQAAAKSLAAQLQALTSQGQTHAVMAIMEDKDHREVIAPLINVVDHWYTGALTSVPRAADAALIAGMIGEQAGAACTVAAGVEQAFDLALKQAQPHDRIVVFGSFYTVAAIQNHLAAAVVLNES